MHCLLMIFIYIHNKGLGLQSTPTNIDCNIAGGEVQSNPTKGAPAIKFGGYALFH